jgi:hypothetical protein
MPGDPRANIECTSCGSNPSSDASQRIVEIRAIIWATAQALALVFSVLGMIALVAMLICLSFAYPDRLTSVGAVLTGLASFIIANHKQLREWTDKIKNRITSGKNNNAIPAERKGD